MSVNLPTALLRNFVAIVDSRSMVGASQQVFLSQSALSFQMKKLEGLVKQPLFQRDGRKLVLTAAGRLLLEYSRKILSLHDEALGSIASGTLSGPIRIGLVQDFSDAFLRSVLSNFSAQHPGAQVYVKVSRTVQLKRLITDAQLDLALGMTRPDDGLAIRALPTRWFGEPRLADQPLIPLALVEAPCRFRESALEALEHAGHKYRIVVEAPNLSALRAAVDAGIGITCRTAMFGDAMSPRASRKLPKLPDVGLALHESANIFPAARRLGEVAAEALANL